MTSLPELKTFYVILEDEEIKLVIRTLQEKAYDLESALKDPTGISEEYLQEQQLEVRNLNEIIRELMYFRLPCYSKSEK